jgi:catechol 1,2-dioxygenase
MAEFNRRKFLRYGTRGLAAWGASELLLRADAAPTETSGELGDYCSFLAAADAPKQETTPDGEAAPAHGWEPTEDNILGPYYRKGAPYRGKVTPPLEPGDVLVVEGRVWGHDTRRPLAHATLDIWQANAQGRYDNDDPSQPPAAGVFLNRTRLVTDESGFYEFESVHPGRYKIGPNIWRPSHVHYMVSHPGYKTLVTQLYFEGDPMNKSDRFIKPSLIIRVRQVKAGRGTYEAGTFDIVLSRS